MFQCRGPGNSRQLCLNPWKNHRNFSRLCGEFGGPLVFRGFTWHSFISHGNHPWKTSKLQVFLGKLWIPTQQFHSTTINSPFIALDAKLCSFLLRQRSLSLTDNFPEAKLQGNPGETTVELSIASCMEPMKIQGVSRRGLKWWLCAHGVHSTQESPFRSIEDRGAPRHIVELPWHSMEYCLDWMAKVCSPLVPYRASPNTFSLRCLLQSYPVATILFKPWVPLATVLVSNASCLHTPALRAPFSTDRMLEALPSSTRGSLRRRTLTFCSDTSTRA